MAYVNASGSFTLAFAEPFDEGWIAELSKNGKAVQTVRSDPLYGSINSFHFDKGIDSDSAFYDKSEAAPDNYSRIVIKYERQYWFDIGIVISVCTLLSVFWLYGFRQPKKLRCPICIRIRFGLADCSIRSEHDMVWSRQKFLIMVFFFSFSAPIEGRPMYSYISRNG